MESWTTMTISRRVKQVCLNPLAVTMDNGKLYDGREGLLTIPQTVVAGDELRIRVSKRGKLTVRVVSL